MGMLPGPEQPRAHPYEKRGKHRKQSVWVTHTRLWHKAVLSLQTLALHQHVHSPIFCIKILWSPMLYALGSKWLHHLHEEEREARIDYPRLASLYFCFPLIWQVPLSVCSVTVYVWIVKISRVKVVPSSLSYIAGRVEMCSVALLVGN